MPRYSSPMRNFLDWWGRAGMPAGEKLHASIAWDSAVDVTCEVLAKRLQGMDAEQLKDLVQDVKAP